MSGTWVVRRLYGRDLGISTETGEVQRGDTYENVEPYWSLDLSVTLRLGLITLGYVIQHPLSYRATTSPVRDFGTRSEPRRGLTH